MSRETKIGMLTGLFVIVIIGVLLSNYLGNNESAPGPKLAAVDNAGEPARKTLQQPAAAPGLRQESLSNAMITIPPVGKPEVPERVAGEGAGLIVYPPTKAEVVGKAHDAVAINDRRSDVELGGSIPGRTEQISFITPEDARTKAAEEMKAKGADTATKVVPAPTTKTETYVIAKGDTLTIIARKFYKSASKADFAKIIAANPGVLKDEKSQLVVGKKLSIPDVKVAPVVVVVPPAGPSTRPSGLTKAPEKAPEKAVDRSATKTYVVQKGDTVERIARKFTGTQTGALAKAIMSANNLKPESTLKIGQKIKVPELRTAAATPVLAGM